MGGKCPGEAADARVRTLAADNGTVGRGGTGGSHPLVGEDFAGQHRESRSGSGGGSGADETQRLCQCVSLIHRFDPRPPYPIPV